MPDEESGLQKRSMTIVSEMPLTLCCRFYRGM